MNLQDLLKIDLLRLEEHWMEQPQLMWEYGEKLAEARYELDTAKANLEKTSSSIELLIRKAPEKFGIAKATEGAIRSLVVQQTEYQEAQERVFKAQKRYEKIKQFLAALEQRKQALENLVRLHGQQYFALPSVKEVDVRELNKVIARKKVKKAMEEKKND